MLKKLQNLIDTLQADGACEESVAKMKHELHLTSTCQGPSELSLLGGPSIWEYNDWQILYGDIMASMVMHTTQPIDDLIARDIQREKDGFPRKIRIGKMIKPGTGQDEKVIVVPSTVEEKLYHDQISADEEGEGQGEGGSGDGAEGEVIGEQPVREESGEGQGGAGQGEGGTHDSDTNAYDLGRILTEQFQLPNLKDKGKKKSLTRYTYDLTDKNLGFGQILDKKATLTRLIATNIALGRVKQAQPIRPEKLLISPTDRVYRILSPEKDYESQAMIFFVRDYSGSMQGKPTELVVTQHMLIYSWLLYQYEKQVETRFILHDTEAREVESFHDYYNLKVAGGTQIASAYKLVNEIVETENLAKDYNIYIFHGTDGDDWDSTGKDAIAQLHKMLTYVNRIGITVAENGYGMSGRTEVERYLKKSGLLREQEALLRMDVLKQESDEARLIEGIRVLTS